jgi:hypothetical protein
MLRILAKRRAGPSKLNIVTCSTCFIRRRSGLVLPPLKKPWAGADDIDYSAIIGRAHLINSRLMVTGNANMFLRKCQQIFMLMTRRKERRIGASTAQREKVATMKSPHAGALIWRQTKSESMPHRSAGARSTSSSPGSNDDNAPIRAVPATAIEPRGSDL